MLKAMLGSTLIKGEKVSYEALTPLEKHLSEKLIKNFLGALEETFKPILDATWSLETFGENLAYPKNLHNRPVVSTSFEVASQKTTGRMRIVFPYGMLQPLHEVLAGEFLGDKMGQDLVWQKTLSQTLPQTTLKLDFILANLSLPLKNMQDWRAGETLIFPKTPESPLTVFCQNKRFFTGKMAQGKGDLCFTIDNVHWKGQIDDI
jgi:flagellar motor switch protein FliM